MAASAKERLEVVVGTDPDPDNGIAFAFTDRAVLFIDPHRPNLVIASELLETQRRMAGVFGKLGIGFLCRLAYP